MRDGFSQSFDDLARERIDATGHRLIDAARTFAAEVIAYLEEWEDEFDAGNSFRRPINFPEVGELFVFEAKRLAAKVEYQRALSYVLSTKAP
jgi:hypothetical protein